MFLKANEPVQCWSTGQGMVSLEELEHVLGKLPLRKLENVTNSERAGSRTTLFGAASIGRSNVPLEEQENETRTPLHRAAPSERGNVPLKELNHVPGMFRCGSWRSCNTRMYIFQENLGFKPIEL
uniref:(northern house mosquito) hypothetical protein n=1 Tax=Culex pipiens TaxID=7175 RepID=A0A8D8JMV5_CULPI